MSRPWVRGSVPSGLALLTILLVVSMLQYEPGSTFLANGSVHPGLMRLASDYSGNSPYVSNVLQDDPSVFYRLGESSGSTAYDSSVNGLNGTYGSSGITLDESGALKTDPDTSILTAGDGLAVSLSDSTGYEEHVPSGNSARTFEAWIKTTGVGSGGEYIVTYGTYSYNEDVSFFLLSDTEFDLASDTGSAAATFTSPYSLADGSWHMLAITYASDGTAAGYVDGQDVGSVGGISALSTELAGGYGLQIGGFYTSGSVYYAYSGYLDEVAVFPSVLTASQVAAQYLAAGYGPVGVNPQGTTIPGMDEVAGGSRSIRCICGQYVPYGSNRTPSPDSISPLNGDFYETTTDLTEPGSGAPFTFTRTYDSQVAQAQAAAGTPGPLGYGWSDNLDMSLSYDSATGVATITEENGDRIGFTLDSMESFTWACPTSTNFCANAPRIEATLKHNSDSSWTFVREAGATPTTFTFSSTGALTAVTYASGQTLSSSTGTPGVAACPSSANSCIVWADSDSANTLTEAFDSSGRLTQVWDGGDNRVTFCYYGQCGSSVGSGSDDLCGPSAGGESENLYTATDPNSLTTTYTYDYSNSDANYDDDMLTLTPPGITTETTNCYDTSGRISKQYNPNGDVLTYSFSGTESSFSGGTTTVTSYPDGTSGTPTEVWSYTYSSNALVAESIGSGSSLASANFVLDPVSLLPLAAVDGNGNASSETLDTYTSTNPISSGQVLTSTDALGNTTQYTYTSQNLLWCTVEPAESAAGITCPSPEPTTPPSADGATINIYNGSDELTSSTDPLGNTTIYGYTSSGEGVPVGLQYCTIEPANYATLISSCPSYGTTALGAETKTFNSDGQVVDSTNALGATTSYTYYTSGNLGLVQSETEYPIGGTSTSPGDTTTFTYNAAGQVIQQTRTSPNGFSATTLNGYDATGRLFCTVAPDEAAQGVICPSSPPTSAPTPGSDPYHGATITTYDPLGRVIQTTNPLGGISITVYDQADNAFCSAGPRAVAAYGGSWPYNCLSTTPPTTPPTTSSDSYLGATLTTYDALGRAVQVTSPTGGITLTTYDSDGNATETEIESNNATNDPTVVTITTYDQDSRPVTSTTGSATTVSYYDPDGSVYCSVSANAYALGAYSTTNTAGYQCPSWESNWISLPPDPTTGSLPLYSSTPDSSQATNVTVNFYDADGNLRQSTNPNVDTSISAYDADGRAYCSATPVNVGSYLSAHSGASWPYLCPTTPPSSPPTGTPGYTTTIYDALGDDLSTTDPTGDTTTYTYDAAGDELTSTDPLGNATSYCYYYENAQGQCASSTTSGSWSEKAGVSSHALNAVSCPTASFCLLADTNGTVFTETSGQSSSGNTLDSGKSIKAVSCASPTFCAVGDNNGNAYVLNGTSWSSATTLDSGVAIKAISCAASFCAAVDASGKVYTYSSGSWTGGTTLDSGVPINAINCPAAALCVAGDANGKLYSYGPSGWASVTTPAGAAIESISCSSEAACLAGNATGKVYSYTSSGGWSTSATTLDSGQVIEQVSCSAPQLCAVATANGNVYVYSGSSWSSATILNSGVVINSVACASWWFCVATDNSGNSYEFEYSGWSETTSLTSTATIKALDCATVQFCIAGDSSGNAYFMQGSLWDAPQLVDSGFSIDAISCPSVATCVAVDNGGHAFVENALMWSSYHIDGTTALDSISCPSTSKCEIGDASGNALTFTESSGTWTWSSSTVSLSGKAITALSCTSTASCWAGASGGKVYAYAGTTWSTSGTTVSTVAITSISCPSSTFCAAGDASGNAYTYTGSSWPASTTTLSASKSIYVSCLPSGSSYFCAAVTSKGKAFTYTPSGGWSSATVTGSSGFGSISCATTTDCVAVDGSGSEFSYTASGWVSDASSIANGTDIDGSGDIEAVSCASSWFCVAGDSTGQVVAYQGGGFGSQLYSTTLPATPSDPAGVITTNSYMPGGGSLVQTKPSGEMCDAYDANNDVIQVDYADTAPDYATTANVTYDYNVDGSEASMVDGTGTTSYTYDANGATTEVSFSPGSGTGLSTSVVEYQYYSTGILEDMVYPSYGSVSSPTVNYAYDAQGNMVSMEDWNSKTTSFTYDADSNLKIAAFPTTGGSAVDYTYDAADNLTDTTVVDPVIWTSGSHSEDLTALTRNADSLIGTSAAASGTPTTFSYDASDRLQDGLGDAYTDDQDGRLATDTPSGGSETSLSYDTGSELCATQVNTTAPSCSTPPSGTTIFGYDTSGDRCYQAVSVTAGSCASPPSSSTLTTYGWDQAGNLTCETAPNTSSATCASPNDTYTGTYVYNGDGLRAADTPAGGSIQQFTWDTTSSVPRIIRDGTNEYLYGPNSVTPIEQINMSTGALSYLVSDNQGVRMGLASSGASDGTESYNSYGVASGSTGSPFGFAGGYTDATGRVYLVNRYYDPATGQFISLDPALPMTLQPYEYVADDPTNAIDPSGAICWQALELGLSTASRNCWSTGYSRAGHDIAGLFSQAADDFGTAVNDALPALHTITGVVAMVASICALTASETVVVAALCGTVALVAASANEATSLALYAEGRESGTTLTLDSVGLAAAGAGKAFEVVSVATQTASDTAQASAEAYSAEAKSASFLGKAVPAFKSSYYATKAGIWGDVADSFAQGSRGAAAVGFGLSTASVVVGNCG